MAGRGLRHWQIPFWGDSIGCNPTDRGKAGSKRSVLVDGSGGPLSVVVAGANVHDTKLLAMTLESVVVERPDGRDVGPQHLCLDRDTTIQRATRPWRLTGTGGTSGE